jgi:glycosyltransferase involved in cell wall biosynthesis
MISVICPVFNEERYILNVLQFFSTHAPAESELFIIDGGSTDRTCDIVNEWITGNSTIHLLHNPDRYVPQALNLAIQNSAGDPVIRLDAHTEYAPDYLNAILSCFQKTGADIVGGPMRAVGKTPFQRAVAYCTSTRLGVGDSSFHDEHAEGEAESVYLGAWKRNVFDDVGMFDTQMIRNQDDEFHYRARSHGKRIYLDPKIRSSYFPRSDLKTLYRQYFQYGLFKPLVLKKVRSGIRFRHLVPSVFVVYFASLPLMFRLIGAWVLIPLGMYLSLIVYFYLKSDAQLNEKKHYWLIYPALHLSYGIGFLKGIWQFIVLKNAATLKKKKY